MSNEKIKLLVVDDNLAMCDILNDYFLITDEIDLCGIAHDGREALDKISSQHPDVVLLDIIMPQLDGLSVLEELRRNPPVKRPCIIVASAIGQENVTNRALSLGADYYLIKPFQLQNLLDRIKLVVDRASMIPSPPQAEVNLPNIIAKSLVSLGMPTHIIGYRYCVQALEILLEEDGHCPLVKYVYPTVAKKNLTAPSCVESAIRKAIGCLTDKEKAKMSNGAFLTKTTEEIKMEFHL